MFLSVSFTNHNYYAVAGGFVCFFFIARATIGVTHTFEIVTPITTARTTIPVPTSAFDVKCSFNMIFNFTVSKEICFW